MVMEDHTGTHVDATLHFYDGVRRTPRGRSIAELPVEKLYGDAVCIDVSAKRGDEPVTAEMLAAAVEKQHVEIRRGDIVLVRFWSGTWGGDAFLGARGLTKEACEWLVERGVKCVGVDHPHLEGRVSEDDGNADCPGHVLLLHPEREIPIVEKLVGLKGLRGKRFQFFALPLKIDGATGSPVRAVALWTARFLGNPSGQVRYVAGEKPMSCQPWLAARHEQHIPTMTARAARPIAIHTLSLAA